MPNETVAPKDVYATLCGRFNHERIEKLGQIVTLAAKRGNRVHLLLQSSGGHIDEAGYFYKLVKSLSADLTVYNSSSVDSAAVIVFLSGLKRIVEASASFMIHCSYRTNVTTHATFAKELAVILANEDLRIKSILMEHLRLSDEHWAHFDNAMEVRFWGQQAIDVATLRGCPHRPRILRFEVGN